MTWEGLSPPYRTIVADPPWPMPETGQRSSGPKDGTKYKSESGRDIDGEWWGRFTGQSVRLPYSTMSVPDIRSLPVHELAEQAAHLYLWTTNRFLEDAYSVVRAWGFRPGKVVTWCKPPIGLGFGGAFASTTEFVITARRGALANTGRSDSTWFRAGRPYTNGHIDHSTKPPAFLDTVERISPGPYVELFARQPRFGWDAWGWGYEKAGMQA